MPLLAIRREVFDRRVGLPDIRPISSLVDPAVMIVRRIGVRNDEPQRRARLLEKSHRDTNDARNRRLMLRECDSRQLGNLRSFQPERFTNVVVRAATEQHDTDVLLIFPNADFYERRRWE